jgi:hypothetical protein
MLPMRLQKPTTMLRETMCLTSRIRRPGLSTSVGVLDALSTRAVPGCRLAGPIGRVALRAEPEVGEREIAFEVDDEPRAVAEAEQLRRTIPGCAYRWS